MNGSYTGELVAQLPAIQEVVNRHYDPKAKVVKWRAAFKEDRGFRRSVLMGGGTAKQKLNRFYPVIAALFKNGKLVLPGKNGNGSNGDHAAGQSSKGNRRARRGPYAKKARQPRMNANERESEAQPGHASFCPRCGCSIKAVNLALDLIEKS